MKKDLLTHFLFMIAFFLFISVFKDWFRWDIWPFWLGGIVGTFLPDVDYLIYAYILRPNKSSSQEAVGLIEKKEVTKTWELLVNSRDNKSELIFHNVLFQLIFYVFTFWVVSSTGSAFAIGLVLAFSLHLLIDQVTDVVELGSIDTWFTKMDLDLDKKQQQYFLIVQIILILILAFYY